MSNRVICACALALATSAGQADVVVDDFSTGGFFTFDDNFAGSQSGAAILGGERDVTVATIVDPFNTPTVVLATASDNPDMDGLSVNMGPAHVSTVNLRYDGNDQGTGLNLDAVDEGIQSIELMFLSVDLPVDLSITLTDGNANSATVTLSLAAGLNQNVFVPLVNFSNIASLDLTEVDSIELDFNTAQAPNVDFFLQEITFSTEVPAPGSIALVGIGGAFALRRRR